MALEELANQFGDCLLWLYYRGQLARWELLIIAVTSLLLLLLITRRHRRLTADKICSQRADETESSNKISEHWQKAGLRIEQLLQEITVCREFTKSLKKSADEPDALGEKRSLESLKSRHSKVMLKEHTKPGRHFRDPATPLDIHELQAVATMAKRLRARSRQKLRS